MKTIPCDKCGGTGLIELSKLAEIRKLKGLTQAQVAEHLGMRRTAYTMVETGKANMLAHRILPLADILGRSPEEILDALYGGNDE